MISLDLLKLPYLLSPGLQQRLDLVHHLIGFGRQVMLVAGDRGSGRSRLLQAIAADANAAWLVVELDGSDVGSPTDLLNVLLDALEPGGTGRPASAADLEARVCRQLAQIHSAERLIVLVADNCDDWAGPINELLLRLAHTENGVGELRVVASCSTDSGYIERFQGVAAAAGLVHLIQIPPFTPAQLGGLAGQLALTLDEREISAICEAGAGNAEQCLKLLTARFPTATEATSAEPDVGADGDSRVDAVADDSTPNDELADADPVVELSGAAPAPTHGLKRAAGLLLVFGTAVGLLLLIWVNRNQERGTVVTPPIEIELTNLQAPSAEGAADDLQIIEIPASYAEPVVSVVESGAELAAARANDAVTPSNEDRFITQPELSSSAPARADELPLTPANQATANEAVKPTSPAPAGGSDNSTAKARPAAKPAPAKPVVAATPPTVSPPPKATKTPVYDPEWLLTNHDNSYVIQLFGVRERNAAENFIERQQLRGKATVFKLEHQAQPWFVVVYGHYANRAAAISALEQLNGRLKSSGPWPRSIGSLKK